MKKIILLGAGYANMALIKKLPKFIFSQYEFILISKSPLHYFSVLLHEVASGVYTSEVTLDINSIIPKEVKFIQDRVLEIKEARVIGQANVYDYDFLVIGLGFESDSFNIPGIKEFSNSIVDYESALNLKKRMFEKIEEHAKNEEDFNIVVCGAGFTGIEFIASLSENLEHVCKNLGVNRNKIKIICVEAMPNILPMFDQNLANIAKNYLENQGVQFELACKILECQKDAIIVEHTGQRRKIKASFIIWTAGVKGNGVIENSQFFTSVKSRVEVNAYLQPINQDKQELMDNIFVIGDCAAIRDLKSQKFYPPTAQIAVAQAEFLAKIFVEKLENKDFSKKFHFISRGIICSLGKKYAIGHIANINIRGKIAVWAKKFIELRWKFRLKAL